MFLRNSWYVVAWSRDVTDKPVAITVLEQPIVIFRTVGGDVSVLEDHCPHRHLPLSKGAVEADGIRCGYHGMKFDGSGRCIEVPSQSAIPPRAKVRSYPAVDLYGWIWAWMGETESANPASIPDFSKLTDPAYRAVGKTNHVRAAYTLVTDNLMDLSHVGYVHQTTIGNPEFTAKGKLTSKRTETGVRVVRLVDDVPPPPTYIKTGVLPVGKNIDRWQVIDFVAPCFVIINVGGKEAGKGALNGDYAGGLNLWVLNAMTPETANSAHYFWSSVRAHALDSEVADKLFFDQVSAAFEEDRVVLEAQQAVLDTRGDSWDIALKSDAGSIEARRVLDALIAEEVGRLSAAA